MPVAPSGIIWFEGVKAKNRGVAMLKEARRIYTAKTGRKPPRISQGGFNAGGVAASAGTHDREAFDTAVAGYLPAWWQAWEEAQWAVGFAAWHRPFIWNVWPEHNHAIPKGGDLSAGARAQERAFRNRRDGLAGNRAYPRIGSYANVTWESYLASKNARHKIKIGGKWYPDIGSVSVGRLGLAWRGTYVSRNVYYVQIWMRKLGLYKLAVDGTAGPKTRAAYDQFRRSIGYSGKDATGLPGMASLSALAKRAKSTKKIGR